MRDDVNRNGEPNRCSNEPATTNGVPTEGGGASRAEWVNLASDPDPQSLGYDLSDWESFRTLDGSDQVMLLPPEESALRDDEFIVVCEESLLELEEYC